MYPYRYRSRIGLICLILMRNPALLIILLVALALSSELRGCEHHEDFNDAAHRAAEANYKADLAHLCETGKVPKSVCEDRDPLPTRRR